MTSATQIQNLPNKALSQIFHKTKGADLLQMRRVCRQWDIVIRSDNQLFNRIIWETSLWGSCLLAAKEITSQNISTVNKSNLLSAIVRIAAPIDIDAAEETALSMGENGCFPLQDIVRAKAEYDISAATAQALAIRNIFDKSLALTLIVKKLVTFDVTAAKALVREHSNTIWCKAFFYIVRKEVEYDLPGAIDTAEAIHFGPVLFKAFKVMVKSTSESEFCSLKDAVSTITHSHYRNKLLAEIVKKEIQHNPSAARATALSIDNMFFRVLALLEIAKADPEQDLTDAKAAAEQVVDLYWKPYKLKALVEIAKVDRQHDFTTAKSHYTCSLKGDPYCYFTLLSHLYMVRAEAKYDLDAARNTALSITDPQYRGYALWEIVKAAIKQNRLDAAKALAKTSEDPYWQFRAILEIVKKEAQTDLQNAEVTAREIHPKTRSEDRDEIFLALVEAKARQNIFAARTEVLAMPNSVLKAKALLKIAEIAQSRLPSRIK